MRFRREGARKFLRYPLERFPGSMMMGDCGAFTYETFLNHPIEPKTPQSSTAMPGLRMAVRQTISSSISTSPGRTQDEITPQIRLAMRSR